MVDIQKLLANAFTILQVRDKEDLYVTKMAPQRGSCCAFCPLFETITKILPRDLQWESWKFMGVLQLLNEIWRYWKLESILEGRVDLSLG